MAPKDDKMALKDDKMSPNNTNYNTTITPSPPPHSACAWEGIVRFEKEIPPHRQKAKHTVYVTSIEMATKSRAGTKCHM